MDQDSETLLILLSRSIRFASDHPYAAVGIFGAMVGSAVTYRMLTADSLRQAANRAFTPKVYQLNLPEEDLRRMLADPDYELRWEMSDASVIVTAEKIEPQKALPDVEGTIE